MSANVRTYWIHALTPLHVGAGEGAGFIDLPVMREKATSWPVIPGSSVKGVLADSYSATPEARRKDVNLRAAFGMADAAEDGSANSGALVFSDARVVFVPIRSLYGTFAWVTSALALRRLKRDLEDAGMGGDLTVDCPGDDDIEVPAGVDSQLVGSGKVYLSDLDFKAKESQEAAGWASAVAKWVFPDEEAWREEFAKRFALVSESVFDFLCTTGTEVTPRIRIDEKSKTVAEGQLWYEESLPSETVAAGLVWCDRVYTKDAKKGTELLDDYCSGTKRLQIGGKATVGRGRVRCLFA